jgi:hypothetical protein
MRNFIKISSFLILAATLSFSQQPTKQEPRERSKFLVDLEKEIAGKENLPAEQVFKNIDVFKGQQAARVLRVMEFAFTPGLGVECNHCHVEGKWENDEKTAKTTARKMWKMLPEVKKLVKDAAGEKAEINCYTCHRGNVEPALTPAGRPRR